MGRREMDRGMEKGSFELEGLEVWGLGQLEGVTGSRRWTFSYLS